MPKKEYRVTGVNVEHDQHDDEYIAELCGEEVVDGVPGDRWHHSVGSVLTMLAAKEVFFVEEDDVARVELIPDWGTKRKRAYVRTEGDDTTKNNLATLARKRGCP